MRVYLLPQDPPFGQFLDITGKEHHYLARVRRVKVGDRFPGTDGRGGNWLCTVVGIGSSSLRLHLEETEADPKPPLIEIHLVQCLPKGKKMDLIVRQASEAGVQRLLPVFSRYSQVGFSGAQAAEKKLQRWQRIARQAVQQSGAARPPAIEPPRKLQNLLQALPKMKEEEVRLVFHQEREAGRMLHRCLSKDAKIITLVIGPEGGLSDEELELLREKRFLPITVGDTVLRTETAALYALAAVRTVIEERQAWEPT
jgi:16S rRNA (uracil1498-N3)-methyltransferase